jgi:hypothetical protein
VNSICFEYLTCDLQNAEDEENWKNTWDKSFKTTPVTPLMFSFMTQDDENVDEEDKRDKNTGIVRIT